MPPPLQRGHNNFRQRAPPGLIKFKYDVSYRVFTRGDRRSGRRRDRLRQSVAATTVTRYIRVITRYANKVGLSGSIPNQIGCCTFY